MNNSRPVVSSPTFLFFTRCDVICDLLQYTHTEKCNPFVKSSIFCWQTEADRWVILIFFSITSGQYADVVPARSELMKLIQIDVKL